LPVDEIVEAVGRRAVPVDEAVGDEGGSFVAGVAEYLGQRGAWHVGPRPGLRDVRIHVLAREDRAHGGGGPGGGGPGAATYDRVSFSVFVKAGRKAVAEPVRAPPDPRSAATSAPRRSAAARAPPLRPGGDSPAFSLREIMRFRPALETSAITKAVSTSAP
jgi:hypothetical protein